jgi:hypothetical protein
MALLILLARRNRLKQQSNNDFVTHYKLGPTNQPTDKVHELKKQNKW